MLASAAELVRPVDTLRGAGIVEWLGELLARMAQATVARLLFGAHLLLLSIGLRDNQRAEYLADEMPARVGGSGASARLSDSFLLGDIIDMLVRCDARAGHGPAQWRRTADEARAANVAQPPLLRQLSIRRLLTEARAAQVDAELSREYERSRRALGWTG